ncbi:MAG: hypothetical protein HYX80_02360 [Chloroflexi bacterium]|nr:hypothetical protein [Chloroflexota bacterium]
MVDVKVLLTIAAILFSLGGVLWLVFVRRLILWLARNTHSEAKAVSSLSSRSGGLFLWRLRMTGIFAVLFGAYLFLSLATPGLVQRVPGYAIAAVFVTPLVAG